MKKFLYTLLITFISVASWGQSEQLFTHYMFNRLNFNPAYAGSKNVLDVGGIYRNQWWSGIEGAPRTFNIYGHMPIAKQKSGIGINFIHDKIGLHKILSFGASYAYRFKLANKNVLALGLGARVENARADWSEANGEVNGADQLFQADSKTTFNVGPGVYFNNRNLYLGLSIPRLLRNSLYNDKDKFGGDVNTYYLQGGYIARLSRHVELHPNAQIRYNPHAPFDFDANLNLWLYDLFMIGANYRYEDSINGLLGLKFRNGLQFGFAMDFTLSDLKQATTGSYEIFVGYTFPCEDCAIQSLRYF